MPKTQKSSPKNRLLAKKKRPAEAGLISASLDVILLVELFFVGFVIDCVQKFVRMDKLRKPFQPAALACSTTYKTFLKTFPLAFFHALIAEISKRLLRHDVSYGHFSHVIHLLIG
jgi:hypothetical protein